MQSSKAAVLAAMAMCASGPAPAVPAFTSSGESHRGSQGWVCGGDNGKGRKKQKRNSKCSCGSGLKAKNCCIYEPEEKDDDATEVTAGETGCSDSEGSLTEDSCQPHHAEGTTETAENSTERDRGDS